MEKLTEILQSTNANIEKLIDLLAQQKKQQQLLKQILQQSNENNNNATNPFIKESIEQQKSFFNVHHNFTVILNLLYNSYHQSENGIEKINNSYNLSENDINTNNNSAHKLENDINTLFNSYHYLEKDINININSYDNLMEGVTKDVASDSQKMIGAMNDNLLQPKTGAIDINSLNPQKYIAGLRVVMLKCNNDSVKNAGIILKQLYQNPKQSHKALMKLTNLSVDGMAKHIRMLKKRELVQKTGFQQYELTEKSLAILRGGMGEMK